ncbi:MAG TPA: MMPL family transporter [Stellaceae bacterium]|nr:MMPL family transporter [Stellaceae bacterium]
MFGTAISRVVDLCSRRAWWVVLATGILAAFCAVYAVRHFAVTTDEKALFPPDLPWAQRAFQYMREFPQPDVTVVVDAPTPEGVAAATARLAAALSAKKDVIKSVGEPQGGAFFERNALLYLPTDQVAGLTENLTRAAPLLAAVSADPSLRGALGALSGSLAGVNAGLLPLDGLTGPLDAASDMAQAALAGRPARFSWQELASGEAQPDQLRRFIEVEPVLDYQRLEPGRAATDAILRTAQQLRLSQQYQAQVRLTGLVPVNDDGFATLTKNAGLNAAISLCAVGLILWLALRSGRIILAVVGCIAAGLAVSAAAGIFMVGALNLISVAFFVLFIGLGIDFGIQFSVRYREERHELANLHKALRSAAQKAGPPLALAAAATIVGFSAFVPTDYRGLSELGEIAGLGMLVAFLASVTVLPALLTVLKPPGELRPMGFAALAPVDRFLVRHRIPVVVGTAVAVIMASPLLLLLRFDFNPLHLQNAKAPAVATFLQLRKNPQIGANAIEIVTPNLDEAKALAQQLRALPEVAQTSTLDTLIPGDQQVKLQLIRRAAAALSSSLHPVRVKAPPSDAQDIEALMSTANALSTCAANARGSGSDAARRLSGLLIGLAKADPAVRARARSAVVEPLRTSLDELKAALNAQQITRDTIPADLKRQWVTPDGQARIQVLPKGDPDDTAVVRSFVAAVLKLAPNATGPAVLLYEAGNTVVRAFVEAGIFALGAILLLLTVTLRRLRDVLLTLLPLLVAAVVTLELSVVLGLKLNFANILALPLLLGVGVAFKIYYVMAWRRGKTALVQSTLTRAVIFSAMTTATAFGSLWMSNDPGTSSMGELMALALLCTMMAAVLFQPALMGTPRRRPDWIGLPQKPRTEPTTVAPAMSPAVEEVGASIRSDARPPELAQQEFVKQELQQ